jgi:cobalt-zinc-cadmium efflux system outer membrane protein
LLCLALPAVAADRLPLEAEQEVESILNRQQIALDDLFRLVELGNPTLAAARSAVRVNAGRVRQTGLYPNPTLEFELEDMSIDDSDHRSEKVTLAQPLVITGRRGNAVAAARAHQDAAGYRLERARREIYRRVHSLWAEQLYLRETGQVLDGLREVANRTFEIAETRFDVRAAPESHRTKALLEVYELEVAEQRLMGDRARAGAELTALLGGAQLPLERLVGTLEPEGVAFETLEGELDQHPAIRAAASSVEAAEAALRTAESERVGDLELFASYGRDRPSNEEFFGAGLALPLPLFDRNQGKVAESRALVVEAKHKLRSTQNDVGVAFTAARENLRTTREELRISEEHLTSAAERALEQAREGYRFGRVPFLDLLDAQRTYSNIRLRNLELKRDLIIAEAELSSLAGIGPYRVTGERP